MAALPRAGRTWAPGGQTPLRRVRLTHDHRAARRGIPAAGRLFMPVQQPASRSPDGVRFLRGRLRQIPGNLLISGDGSPIHRAQPSQDCLPHGAAKRLHLEPFPGYAPDLHPA